ncbi:MAG: YbaK/EbsC family protein [Caldilineaceae bacterium]
MSEEIPERTPADLARFIAAESIAARLIADIGETPTVPAAAAALGVCPEQIVKTLLFLVETPAAPDGQPVVVISNGESRVDRRPVADYFGVGKKRVRLAPPEVVLALLGYPTGGVPPFDHITRLPVLLDSAITAFDEDELVYGGGGDHRTMLELTVGELVRVVQPELLALSAAV